MLEGATKLAIVTRKTVSFRVITPVEDLVAELVRGGKTGSLTINFSQGGIGGYEWTETQKEKKLT